MDYTLYKYSLGIALLDRFYLTRRRIIIHLSLWAVFSLLSASIVQLMPKGLWQHVGMGVMAAWLLAYGLYQSRKIITTYHRAVRLFDDTHSEDIGAYIRWMSILTWWAVIYGASCRFALSTKYALTTKVVVVVTATFLFYPQNLLWQRCLLLHLSFYLITFAP